MGIWVEQIKIGKIPWRVRVKVKVAQSFLTLCNPMHYTVHGILQARILEWVAIPFSRGSSQHRNQTQVSHIAGDSLPAKPQGKPKNTEVGSLSLLQWISPTQGSNQGLLHCRRILYQLSYEGRREWLDTPVLWPGEFHGLYSPWGHKESDMTKRLSLSQINYYI